MVEALTPREREPLGKHLQMQWQENLRVEIKWQPMEYQAWVKRICRKLPPMFLGRWVADYPDPDNFLRVGPSVWLPGWRNGTRSTKENSCLDAGNTNGRYRHWLKN